MDEFIGRKEELAKLNRLRSLNRASLVVIKGRRRVGKSTLAKHFAQNMQCIALSGNAPSKGMTAQEQRNAFADQLCNQLQLPRATFLSWTDAFHFLGKQVQNDESVILLDEISWMGGADPTFLGALKTWWDQFASERKNVILLLCGSISTWIDENILCSTGFVGRIALVIHLMPLSIVESAALLRGKGFKGSSYELYKILSVMGGIPWYLNLVHPHETADENIYSLCFDSSSQLVSEFETIFHDLFEQRGEVYRKIIQHLVSGMKTQQELRTALSMSAGGTITKYMQHLVAAGFVSEHYQWSLKTCHLKRQKLYRLSDCFMRFHLKYVEPYQALVMQGARKHAAKGRLPGWDAIMGFQLENLLLSNRDLLLQALGIEPDLILCDNPFIQSKTSRTPGCQIDYLIQTKLNSLVICEFKSCKNELNSSVISEMQAKSNKLVAPKGCGKVAALFHIGGVAPSVENSQFFYRIVDLRDWISE